MSLLKNLVAGVAAVAVYKLVDHGLRKLERDVLDRDVPAEEGVSPATKDAIVVAGSRFDRIPTVAERDAIANGINLVGSILTTALFLQGKELFLEDDEDEDYDPDWLKSLAIAGGMFALNELVAKPAFGMSEPDGRSRRFVSHMASKGTQNAVRQMLA